MRSRSKWSAGVVVGLGLVMSLSSRQAATQAPVATDRVFPVEMLREDLATLWAALDEGHGGLDRYVPREVTKRRFDAAMEQLTKPLTELKFYRLVSSLVAGIEDGHTRVVLSDAGRASLAARPVYFPFEVRFIDGRTYLLRNLSADRSVSDGAEVLEINGTPIEAVRQALAALPARDGGVLTRPLRLLERPSLFGEYLATVYGPRESFRLTIRRKGQEPAVVTVKGVTLADLERVRRERYPETAVARPRYDLAYRGSTAVLTIRGFGNDRTPGAQPYPEFLLRVFRELAEKRVPSLVIDLRGNGGGVDEFGRLLFAHFMDRPFRYYRALEVKKNRFDFMKNAGGETPDFDRPAVRRNARGWYDVTDHPNVGTLRPEEPRFAGKTAILVDGLSFSTTGETTSLFHCHTKATFIGEECGAGYYGNTSGGMPLLTLPRTGLGVVIPLVRYTLEVDGYPADRGIVPDIVVTPTIDDLLAGRDVVLERALRAVAATPGA